MKKFIFILMSILTLNFTSCSKASSEQDNEIKEQTVDKQYKYYIYVMSNSVTHFDKGENGWSIYDKNTRVPIQIPGISLDGFSRSDFPHILNYMSLNGWNYEGGLSDALIIFSKMVDREELERFNQ